MFFRKNHYINKQPVLLPGSDLQVNKNKYHEGRFMERFLKKKGGGEVLGAAAAGYEDESEKELDYTYWYGDEQINALVERHIINERLGHKILYYRPAEVRFLEDFRDNFKRDYTRMLEEGKFKSIFFPFNIGGNHWVACVITFSEDGHPKLIYIDSLGGGVDKGLEGAFLETIEEIEEEKELAIASLVIDLGHRQQNNGHDCGPLTVHNLINLIDNYRGLNDLDVEEIKGIIGTPTEAEVKELRDSDYANAPGDVFRDVLISRDEEDAGESSSKYPDNTKSLDAKDRRLDSIARIVTGGDVCTAVIFDGEDLLIANNNGHYSELVKKAFGFFQDFIKDKNTLASLKAAYNSDGSDLENSIEDLFDASLKSFVERTAKGDKYNKNSAEYKIQNERQKLIHEIKAAERSLKDSVESGAVVPLDEIESVLQKIIVRLTGLRAEYESGPSKGKRVREDKEIEDLRKKIKESYDASNFKELYTDVGDFVDNFGFFQGTELYLAYEKRVSRDLKKLLGSLAIDSHKPLNYDIKNAIMGGLVLQEGEFKKVEEADPIVRFVKSVDSKDRHVKHAEMILLDYIIDSGGNIIDKGAFSVDYKETSSDAAVAVSGGGGIIDAVRVYPGISKLCCLNCHLAIKAFNDANSHSDPAQYVETRGAHDNGFPGWVKPKFIESHPAIDKHFEWLRAEYKAKARIQEADYSDSEPEFYDMYFLELEEHEHNENCIHEHLLPKQDHDLYVSGSLDFQEQKGLDEVYYA